MKIKSLTPLIFFSIFWAASAYAANLVGFSDDWTYNWGRSDDGVVWGGYPLDTYAFGYNSQADCLCWDWCDDGSSDETYSNWDSCWCSSTTKRDQCKIYSPWMTDFDSDGKVSIGSLNAPHSINTGASGDRWKCGIDLREYRDCDGSAGAQGTHNHEDQDGTPYYVVYPKRQDCDLDNYDTEGYFSANSLVIWDQDRSCGTYRRCDTNSAHTDHDEQNVFSATADIPSACSKRDGATINYACNSSSQCYSGNCGGGKLDAKYICDSDGSDLVQHWDQFTDHSCGGSGYIADLWGFHSYLQCSVISGSGFVCDEDHDNVIITFPPNPPNPCRKDIGQSCSLTTDCWNDDGGNFCNSLSKCTDGANGRNCGIDSDCDSGRCDSTCQAKLADGQSCNENSDCINSNCISGICGGLPPSICGGTLEVNALDGSQRSIYGARIKINGVLSNTTDSGGQAFIKINSVQCGFSQNLSVECADQTTQCHSAQFQTDFNGDSDVFTLNCNICLSDQDLYIGNSDIKLTKSGSNTITAVNVHSTGIASSFVTVRFQSIGENGLINAANSEDKNITISAGTNKTVTFTKNLDSQKYINIYVDPNNQFNESNFNNYVFRPIVKKVNAYLSISTDSPYLDGIYREFLESFVNSVDENSADFVISVGHKTPEFSQNDLTLLTKKWGYDLKNKKIFFNSAKLDLPYNAVVGIHKPITKPIVFVLANDVDGMIAGLKRLVSGSEYFFDSANKNPSVIDRNDVLGIGVYDVLHNDDNKNHYKKNNDQFKAIVKDVLFDNIFDVSIRTVKTRNTTSYGNSTILRVKHVNSDFSEKYKDSITENPNPIVFSGGFFNDLIYWENQNNIGFDNDGLALELSREGRDVWEIEIIGGPEQDGSQSSPNYNYNDTRDYYWPSLIAGVQQYSNKDNLTYVGHSNGCGVALASLNKYQVSGKNNAGFYFDYDTGGYLDSDLSANPVDTFIGIGCPGNFNGYSFFKDYFGQFGENIQQKLAEKNHINGKDIGTKLILECEGNLTGKLNENQLKHCRFTGQQLKKLNEFSISKQLAEDYLTDIKNINNPPQVDAGLPINRLRLYINNFTEFSDQGFFGIGGISGNLEEKDLTQDVVVSSQDSVEIAQLINSNTNKEIVNLSDFFHGYTGHSEFRRDVKRFLDGKE